MIKITNINKRLLAMGTAFLMTTSFAGCSKNEKVESEETTTTATITQVTTAPVTELENIIKEVVTEKEVEETVYTGHDCNCECCKKVDEKTEETTVVTTVAPVVTEELVTTTKEVTTEAPVTTTKETTTEAPATTTTKTTTKAPVATESSVSYVEIDMQRFEMLTENLKYELDKHGIVKSMNKKFTKQDLYSTVYIYNIDFIDDSLKQELINKGYIAEDAATLLVDAASVRDAITTFNQTRLKLNTNLDEICFALNYLKDDEQVHYELSDDEGIYSFYDYNSTNKVNYRVTEKIKELDLDEYYEARDKYLSKHDINQTVVGFISTADDTPKEFVGIKSYQIEDFVDISVAINDREAKSNVYTSLKLAVKASLDNSKAVNSLNDYSNFHSGDKENTNLTDCGAGPTFAINTNIYAFSVFMGQNEYKNLQYFAKDAKQYEQIKKRYNIIVEDSQLLNDVVRIHEECKQYTR